MSGFAMIFGDCVIAPPSAKAALVMLLYFFGIGSPGLTPADYRAAIIRQYVAVGKSQIEAVAAVQRFDRCAAEYIVPHKDHSP